MMMMTTAWAIAPFQQWPTTALEGSFSLAMSPHPLWLGYRQCLHHNPSSHGDYCHCLPPFCPVVFVVFHPSQESMSSPLMISS